MSKYIILFLALFLTCCQTPATIRIKTIETACDCFNKLDLESSINPNLKDEGYYFEFTFR